MDTLNLEYMRVLESFIGGLEDAAWDMVAKKPKVCGVVSVDMINGFCRTGNLASPRIEALIPEVVRLLEGAWEAGIRDFALLHDCHSKDTPEFDAFAQHGMCGSEEAQAVDEIKKLSFFEHMRVFEKNSLHPAHGTMFDEWLRENAHLETFIIIGNCTDLCVYQTAMHLRMTANAFDLDRRVIVPENCVNTYDLSIETAKDIGAQPHPGDFLHTVFLHHMAMNGIEIVTRLTN